MHDFAALIVKGSGALLLGLLPRQLPPLTLAQRGSRQLHLTPSEARLLVNDLQREVHASRHREASAKDFMTLNQTFQRLAQARRVEWSIDEQCALRACGSRCLRQ